jgi:hypothetical protein
MKTYHYTLAWKSRKAQHSICNFSARIKSMRLCQPGCEWRIRPTRSQRQNPEEDMTSAMNDRLKPTQQKLPGLITSDHSSVAWTEAIDKITRVEGVTNDLSPYQWFIPITGQNNPRKELYEPLIDGIIIKDDFINKRGPRDTDCWKWKIKLSNRDL